MNPSQHAWPSYFICDLKAYIVTFIGLNYSLNYDANILLSLFVFQKQEKHVIQKTVNKNQVVPINDDMKTPEKSDPDGEKSLSPSPNKLKDTTIKKSGSAPPRELIELKVA